MLLKQSAARHRVVLMVDSSDHITGKTGLTLAIRASKDGADFDNIGPTVTELEAGFYRLALTSVHTDTLGDLALHITAAGADPTDYIDEVVADLPGAVQGAGTGAYTVTVTVTDGTAPLENAVVRLTEGITSYVAMTDADGHADFALDAATYDVAVTKPGYSFTPTTRTVVGSQAGTVVDDLVLGLAPTSLPSVPTDATVCRVFGTLETVDNRPAAGVSIVFELVAPTLTRSERLLSGRTVTVKTNAAGQLKNSSNEPFIDLQRNDMLTPADTTWMVTCDALNLPPTEITLDQPTFDLLSIFNV